MLITIIHWLFILYPYIHIFLIPGYDIILVSYANLMILAWGLLKGDCWITTIAKKLKDPNYVIGSDIFHANDLAIPNQYYDTVMNVLRFGTVVIFFGILIRSYNIMNTGLWTMVYITLIIYIYLLYKKHYAAFVFQYLLIFFVLLNYIVYIINYMQIEI